MARGNQSRRDPPHRRARLRPGKSLLQLAEMVWVSVPFRNTIVLRKPAIWPPTI